MTPDDIVRMVAFAVPTDDGRVEMVRAGEFWDRVGAGPVDVFFDELAGLKDIGVWALGAARGWWSWPGEGVKALAAWMEQGKKASLASQYAEFVKKSFLGGMP